jgi:hypothetical protein
MSSSWLGGRLIVVNNHQLANIMRYKSNPRDEFTTPADGRGRRYALGAPKVWYRTESWVNFVKITGMHCAEHMQ